MPTYEFLHQVPECNHEWELEQSIKANDPEECPKCQGKENIIRLISGGSGKGIVNLEGREYVEKVKQDAKNYAKEVYGSEKQYANVLGESNYNRIQSSMDRAKREKW